MGQEGPQVLMRAAVVDGGNFHAWECGQRRPQFKAEYIVTHTIVVSSGGGKGPAERMRLDQRKRRR